MSAQEIIASLCADIALTKQICEIDHRKFNIDTKISWALESDRDETLAAIKKVTAINKDIKDFQLPPLLTVGDAFRHITILSTCPWA